MLRGLKIPQGSKNAPVLDINTYFTNFTKLTKKEHLKGKSSILYFFLIKSIKYILKLRIYVITGAVHAPRNAPEGLIYLSASPQSPS